ncbi:MAG TPA: DUF4402 domain-containing protein [Sphingomicrobium sp.]
MSKFLRAAALAATAAALTVRATPALAVGPNTNATGTAHIVKPLTLLFVRNLNLGTIVLGSGSWTNASVGISRAGAFTCANANTTCTGATQTAQYKITGTNNQDVTINAPNVTLTNQNDGVSTLLMSVDNPGTVNLGNSGSSGLIFDLGGNITVNSTTPDGTYVGTFNVTVNY